MHVPKLVVVAWATDPLNNFATTYINLINCKDNDASDNPHRDLYDKRNAIVSVH